MNFHFGLLTVLLLVIERAIIHESSKTPVDLSTPFGSRIEIEKHLKTHFWNDFIKEIKYPMITNQELAAMMSSITMIFGFKIEGTDEYGFVFIFKKTGQLTHWDVLAMARYLRVVFVQGQIKEGLPYLEHCVDSKIEPKFSTESLKNATQTSFAVSQTKGITAHPDFNIMIEYKLTVHFKIVTNESETVHTPKGFWCREMAENYLYLYFWNEFVKGTKYQRITNQEIIALMTNITVQSIAGEKVWGTDEYTFLMTFRKKGLIPISLALVLARYLIGTFGQDQTIQVLPKPERNETVIDPKFSVDSLKNAIQTSFSVEQKSEKDTLSYMFDVHFVIHEQS